MTVTATTTTASVTGDGSATEFATGFAFQGTGSTSELVVVERVIATGAETTKSYTSHYTVTGGDGSTGTVIAVTAPASTVQWHIRRNTTQTQTTDYVENDPFPADTHETALDRAIMILQEHETDIALTFAFPDTYTGGASTAMPEPAASKLLAWNSSANALENITVASVGSIAASDATPIIAGTGAAGTATTYARGDHVHPSGVASIVADTTPQLGGQLDVNSQAIGDGTRELLTFTEDGSAVNHWNIENQASGGGPILRPAGDDSNIDAVIESKGTGLIQLKDLVRFNVGADVASTTALPLLKDGTFVDVTGTTTVTSFASTGIGSMIVVQFDAALVLTHHSTDLILPGAANITTAAGDIGIFYEYASGDYRCVSYQLQSTAPSGVGGLVFLATTDISSTPATVNFTAVNAAAYDAYMIVLQNVIPTDDDVHFYMRTSTDGGSGYDVGTSYDWTNESQGGGNNIIEQSTDDAQIRTTGFSTATDYTVGSEGSEDGVSGVVFVYGPHLAKKTQITWQLAFSNAAGGAHHICTGGGQRNTSADVDAWQFLFEAGELESGTITTYGIKNA